jgi:hypothetical protein
MNWWSSRRAILRPHPRFRQAGVGGAKEFEGRSHYSVIGGEGWEEVADYALEWAVEHAARTTD